jgi:protein gp37
MGTDSKIEWTDHTWNPWYGCPDDGKRSPACDNCYARAWAKRSGIVDFDSEIKRASDKTFYAPLNRKKYKSGDRVFVCSLSDFFHPDTCRYSHHMMRDAFDDVINERPDLTWIFLTKRPENVGVVYSQENWAGEENHWLGVTVENQEQADKRIPELLKIPAAVRFVSCEPLLGHVDLAPWVGGRSYKCKCAKAWHHTENNRLTPQGQNEFCTECRSLAEIYPTLDWVICGGESGHNARPMHPDWARSLRDQCAVADAPFLFKQWGEWGVESNLSKQTAQSQIVLADGSTYGIGSIKIRPEHRSGTGTWKPDLAPQWMYKVGKKTAGRKLYGVEHLEWPSVEEKTNE